MISDKKSKNVEVDFEARNKNPKPFLKKGTGLARYGLNLEEVKNKKGKLKFNKPKIIHKVKIKKKIPNEAGKTFKSEFSELNLSLILLIIQFLCYFYFYVF